MITFVREIEHLDFVGRGRAARRRRPASSSRYTTTGRAKERGRRKQLVEAMDKAVEWYHERLLTSPDARQARDYLRRRGLDGDVPRQFKLGWAPDDWDALAASLASPDDVLRDTGSAFTQQAQAACRTRSGPGCCSRSSRRRAIRWPSAGGSCRARRPGEVQELAGDADLREVQDALRAELGQGRHRQGRPGHRVRGLHRRDRLPSRRRAAGGGHLRHGADRGARAAAEAVRQPGRAGLRRRRRRPGRRGTVLRVGAEVRGRGAVARFPKGKDPGDLARSDPGALATRVDDADAVPRLPAAAGARRQPAVRRRQRPGTAEAAMAVVNEHPTSTSASCTPAGGDHRSGCRSATSSQSPSGAAASADAGPSSAERRGSTRERRSSSRSRCSCSDWDEIAPWLVEALFADESIAAAFLALARPGGDVARGARAGRPRGA